MSSLLGMLKHIKISKDEFYDILLICIIFAFMFALSFFRFGSGDSNFMNVFLAFFLFILLTLTLRLYFMKSVSYFNGFEIKKYITDFDRYGIRDYDRFSYYKPRSIVDEDLGKKEIVRYNQKGLPSIFISFFIYIFSIGFIIFPSVWRYKVKKIDYMYAGTYHKKEVGLPWVETIDVTGYRYSRTLFAGFVFYFFYLVLLSFMGFSISTYNYWFYFITMWIAIITTLPIPGTEGYDLFICSRFAWICAITMNVLGFLAILIFNNLTYLIFTVSFCMIMIIFLYFWKILVDEVEF